MAGIPWITDTDDDGTGLTGTVRTNAWTQSLKTKIDAWFGDWTSWTPTIGGSTSQSGQTYAANGQIGRYKISSKGVEFTGTLSLSAVGTITGSVVINGLPSTPTSGTNRYASVCIGYWGNMTSSFCSLSGTIPPGTAYIVLRGVKTAAATSMADLVQADLSATSSLIFSGFYEID